MADRAPDPKVREITDAKVLAAMAHPLRRRLMDQLLVNGPATASTLAEATGSAVGNISHHLRALAAVELVAEAPELARDRRERWWRLVKPHLRWSSTDFADDPASEAVEQAVVSLNLDANVGHVRAWYGADDDERTWWGEGPFAATQWLSLTPDELEQFGAELKTVLLRWRDRELPDDGHERRSVFTFAYGMPARP